MTEPHTQVLARLAWVSHISAWGNVHPEMIPVVTGLIQRGLVERVVRDNGLRLTEAGEEMLRDAGVPFIADLASNGTAGKAHELIPGAEYWIDPWGERIPR